MAVSEGAWDGMGANEDKGVGKVMGFGVDSGMGNTNDVAVGRGVAVGAGVGVGLAHPRAPAKKMDPLNNSENSHFGLLMVTFVPLPIPFLSSEPPLSALPYYSLGLAEPDTFKESQPVPPIHGNIVPVRLRSSFQHYTKIFLLAVYDN